MKLKGCLANLLTLAFLAGAAAAVWFFLQVWNDPFTPLNPFPPFTPIPVVITATFLPPTATATATLVPTATFTPLPIPSTATPNPFPFSVANGGAAYIPNSNDQACAWSSIAGTVGDAAGNPLRGYGVRVRGGDLDKTVFSGDVELFGPGSFELRVATQALVATFTVQLFSPEGVALSPEVTVITSAECTKNVAVLSFMSR